MCGRYSNAQPPHQFTAAVRDQLEDRHRPAARQTTSQQQQQHHKDQNAASQDKSRSSSSSTSPPILSQLKEGDYYPTHNVSPSSRAPILRLEKPVPIPFSDKVDDTAPQLEDNALVIECMRWGLLPARTQFIPHGADALRTINARDDTVMSGQSMWTPLLKKGKRCIVFCQGFYEWLKKPDGTRIAHFCGMQDEGCGRIDVNGGEKALMPMAGLYEQCTIDGQDLLSFTIITTESNNQLNFLHDRMPVILADTQSMMMWLGVLPASLRELCSLLKPYSNGELDLYPVPREVGKVGNDDKSFILPVSARKDGIAAAFGRRNHKADEDVNSETHAPIGEEMKAVTDGKRKRQLEDDEEMAKAMQAEEEEIEAKRLKTEGKEELEEENQDEGPLNSTEGDQVKEEHPSEVKAEGQDDDIIQPSSRFSPEPFNPPISSPPRSKEEYHKEPSPRKTPNKGLAEAAKGSKDIRNFFGGSK